MTIEQLIESLKGDQEAVKALTLAEIEKFYLGLIEKVKVLEVLQGQNPKVAELEAKIAELELKVKEGHELIKKLEEIIASYKG